MASPFTVFRKNQKTMMAAACLLAIIAFVFLPVVMDRMGSQTVRNAVVVETAAFGDLREWDVSNLRRQRQELLAVFSNVLQAVGLSQNQTQQWLETQIGNTTEQSVVNSWLLARYAQQMGMVVSNELINGFLAAITQNMVKRDVFLETFRRMGISERQFLDAVRDELARQQLQQIFMVSMAGITPAQRWDYFTRVKQTATIEAAAVPVADYLDRVEEPSEAELKAFFEKHKTRDSRADSPEPGFHEPQKVALEYFKADAEKFIAPEMVTEQEILEYYEKHKEEYQQMEKRLEEIKAKLKAESPSVEAKKSEESKEAAAAPAANDAEKPAEPNADQKPAAPQTPDKTEEPKSKDTSAAGHKSPFLLTALLQESKEAASQPAEKESPEAAADKPAAEKPAEAKPVLSEITRGHIRSKIAAQKVEKIFALLREPMDAYRREWSKYKVATLQPSGHKQSGDSKKPLPSPPAKPDLEKLAKENGLSFVSTGLISQADAASLDIGASVIGGSDWVGAYAFQSTGEFRPEQSQDLAGNWYLFWKTEETAARVPKFEDPGVREQVLQAWKMIEARKLALEAAQALADDAAKADKPLKQAFAERSDLPIIAPPPFTWVTFGNVPLGSAPSAARLSDVPGIEHAGEEFMRTVFRLEPGQVGVAMNAPQTIAYVVQPAEFSPTHAVLWQQFEVDDFSKYAPAAQADRQRLFDAWLDEIKSATGFKWMRDPDPVRDSAPSEEN